MHFIETIFGLAPDAGSGSLEAALALSIAAIVLASILVRKRTRAARRE